MEALRPLSANSAPLTPIGFLERAATAHTNSLSVIHRDKTYTWAETYTRCLRLASSISSLLHRHNNLSKPVVSVFAPNIPALYELHFAIPMAGAVLNSLNTRLDHRTVSVLLRHCSSQILFADSLSIPFIDESLSHIPSPLRPIVIPIGDEDKSPDTNVTGLNVLLPSHILTDLDYESLISSGDPKFNWVQPKSEWDPIALNYTSGTTSSPKGVVHSHRGAYLLSLDSVIDWPLPSEAVYLWTLPMFHANGWSYTWGTAAVGATNVCLRKVNAETVFSAIRRHEVTHMCGAPVVLNMLTNTTGHEEKRLEKPVNILTAGAPPPAAVLMRAEDKGFIVSHGYGLTETGGAALTCAWKSEWNRLPAADRARLKARQGVRKHGLTDADVINPKSGEPVKRDGKTVGEVVLRGGCLMLGYLNDPEGTAKCMRDDGWFMTGDVGVIHPDGYLEIKDRSKDIIISGGENISSVEVESVLYTNPAVKEAAVVARPDDYWGETPCAFVSLKSAGSGGDDDDEDKPPSEAEIIEYCRSMMPHYMVPKTVVIKDVLPRTSTGKVQKFMLREIAKGMGSLKYDFGLKPRRV